MGVSLSVGLHLYRTSRPHVTIVGQVPGTEHFRNIMRHTVVTVPDVISLRIDESLYFPNARFLEDQLYEAVARDKIIRHVVLNCAAVNRIDVSALESLEEINNRLRDAGVSLHLTEVKGPVTDKLAGTHFLKHLSGKIHLTHYDALCSLAPEISQNTLKCERGKPPPTIRELKQKPE